MPGTIQVSVLGFHDGIETSSASSSTSIKVSMGEREHQTWDKGDFSFPLTTLRDKLVITLLDGNGIEISHTGVETRLIVEKGLWEETFALEGGGSAHLKLWFVLSEEDRDRIRVLRQSALRKKHEELVNSTSKTAKTANSGLILSRSGEVSGLSNQDLQTSQTKVAGAGKASLQMKLQSLEPDLETKHKNDTDREHETSSTPRQTLGQLNTQKAEVSVKDRIKKTDNQLPPSDVSANSVFLQVRRQGKRSSLERTPRNVRKMISAFETGLTREIKPRSTKIRTDSFLGSHHSDHEVNRNKARPENVQIERASVPSKDGSGHMQKEADPKTDGGLELAKVEKPSASGRTDHGHLKSDLFTKQSLEQSPVIKEREKGICSKDSDEIHTRNASNKSKQYDVRSSDLWIYPDETGRLCITSGGQRAMNVAGGCRPQTHAYQKKMVSSIRGNIREKGARGEANVNGWKYFQRLNKPKPENSADAENSRGPVGQVMRAAIMVGFAALVLLTRKQSDR